MNKIHLSSAAFAAALIIALPVMANTLNSTTTLIDQRDAAPQNITSDDPQFTRVIDDLPLMPGLETVPDEDTLFVTPGAGRIAETTAQGPVDIDDMYHFYKRTLPQLGWRSSDMHTYRRDGEVLHIEAHADGKVTTVHFAVHPTDHK